MEADEYVNFALRAARLEEIAGPSVELISAIAIALIFFMVFLLAFYYSIDLTR